MLEAIKAASRPVNLIYRAALDNKAPTAVRASISNFVSELKARFSVLVTCVNLSWQNLSVLACVGPEPVLARQPVCFAEWLKKRRFYRRRGAQRSRCGCSSSSTGADKLFAFKFLTRGSRACLGNLYFQQKETKSSERSQAGALSFDWKGATATPPRFWCTRTVGGPATATGGPHPAPRIKWPG